MFKKQSYLFIVLVFSFLTSVKAQNNNGVQLLDETFIQSDSCLNNKSDFSKLKLFKKYSTLGLDSLKIKVETNNKKKDFTTIESFNTFDFKFWLLSNDGFKNQGNFEILVTYRIKGLIISKSYRVCLDYVENIEGIRGELENPDFVELDVFFGTDRNYNKSEALNNVFGGKRSSLKYGVVTVSIPHDHRVGEIESPSIWKFEFSEDPSKHIMLREVKLFKKENFFEKLSDDIQMTTRKRTFLFVHGYNTSFSEAAKRTAQISYDLKFDGKAVFYSWPSQASTIGYRKDEKNIEWSQKNIKSFLTDYLTKSGAEDIYLVAHSMGNRGLTRALIEVLEDKPELRSKIKEIILAAPDIDAEVFKNQIAPQMVSSTQKPITLYISADDLALKASQVVNGKPRAGDAGEEIIVIDGIETIDATGVDTSFLSHSYFADTNSIISDIFEIFQSGLRALNREHLFQEKWQNSMYWKIKN